MEEAVEEAVEEVVEEAVVVEAAVVVVEPLSPNQAISRFLH